MPRFLSRLAVAGTAVALTAGLITPSAAQAAAEPSGRVRTLAWAALGDSYTAGFVEAAGAETEPRDGCARTTGSYPELIRRGLGPLVELRNVSCSGATVKDVYQTKEAPPGRPLPPLGTNPGAPFPPVPSQIDAVSPSADVITVEIGGNTLGFAEILKGCIELGAAVLGQGTPCKDKFDASLPDRFDQLRGDFDQMLGALHAKAPSARLLAVGYPTSSPRTPPAAPTATWSSSPPSPPATSPGRGRPSWSRSTRSSPSGPPPAATPSSTSTLHHRPQRVRPGPLAGRRADQHHPAALRPGAPQRQGPGPRGRPGRGRRPELTGRTGSGRTRKRPNRKQPRRKRPRIENRSKTSGRPSRRGSC